MTVTEQQAKEKWCPMTHRDNQLPHSKCISSECMMWEWAPDHEQPTRNHIQCANPRAITEPDRSHQEIPASWEWRPFDSEDNDYAYWIEPETETSARRKGNCGLSRS